MYIHGPLRTPRTCCLLIRTHTQSTIQYIYTRAYTSFWQPCVCHYVITHLRTARCTIRVEEQSTLVHCMLFQSWRALRRGFLRDVAIQRALFGRNCQQNTGRSPARQRHCLMVALLQLYRLGPLLSFVFYFSFLIFLFRRSRLSTSEGITSSVFFALFIF